MYIFSNHGVTLAQFLFCKCVCMCEFVFLLFTKGTSVSKIYFILQKPILFVVHTTPLYLPLLLFTSRWYTGCLFGKRAKVRFVRSVISTAETDPIFDHLVVVSVGVCLSLQLQMEVKFVSDFYYFSCSSCFASLKTNR